MNKSVNGKEGSFHHPWKNEKKAIAALLSATTKRLAKVYLYTTCKTEWLTFTYQQEPRRPIEIKVPLNHNF